VEPYAAPQLTLTAHRCTEDGTADETGEYCEVTITGSTTQVNGRNTAALSFTYGSTTKSIAVSVGSFTHTEIVPAASTATLALSATLSDKLLSATRSMTLSVGYATMDFFKGGRGIAFGTTATKEGFTCAMDADFSGHPVTGLADPVNATDATTKKYVDEKLTGIGVGGTLMAIHDGAGNVTLGGGGALKSSHDGSGAVTLWGE
jgi:hypothetical protein